MNTGRPPHNTHPMQHNIPFDGRASASRVPPPQPNASKKAGGYIPSGRPDNIFREGNKSLRGQWREGGDIIDTTKVQSWQIADLHANLAVAYECNIKDINYVFYPIVDLDDQDRFDCLDLHFILTYFCDQQKKYVQRTIYTAKVLVPEEIKLAAERQRAMANANLVPTGRPSNQRRSAHPGQ